MKTKLIGFMGAPGSGKTTLAFAMKEYLLTKKISSDVCSEYAREFCFRFGVPKSTYTQYRINLGQMDREDAFMKGTNDYVFADSCIWMGYSFALVHLKKDHEKEAHSAVSDIYDRFVIGEMNRYDKVFYLKNNSAFDDGCRDMDVNRKIAEVMEGFVRSHQYLLPIVTIDVSIEETEKRKEIVWECLRGM